MRYLLDTQILIWAESNTKRLTPEVRSILENEPVTVSTASLWEMAIKVSLQKLRLPASVKAMAAAIPFDLLPIRPEHAAALEHLPHYHSDPFDRMLVAQAMVERLVLLTADSKLRDYGTFVQML